MKTEIVVNDLFCDVNIRKAWIVLERTKIFNLEYAFVISLFYLKVIVMEKIQTMGQAMFKWLTKNHKHISNSNLKKKFNFII